MKNQQRLIVGLVLALVLIVFAILNGQAVDVNFFGASFSWPLIVVIAVSVIIGAVITLLVSTGSMSQSRKQLTALQKENKALTAQQEAAIAKATKAAEDQITDLQAQLKAAQAPQTPTSESSTH